MNSEPIEKHRGAVLAAAAAAGAACWLLLTVTEPSFPIVWDEGEYLDRADAIEGWFRSLLDPSPDDRESAFSPSRLNAGWPYALVNEGHPTGTGWLIVLGNATAGISAHPLSAARRGTIALFGLAAAAMFYRLARERTWTAACAATASLICMPRMFAHAHFAALDGPLTAAWILAWATFAPALRSLGAAACWGAALGLTCSMKFTGWFAWAPFLAWAILYGDRRAARAFAVGLPVALLTFWLLNPPLWPAPFTGLWTHFEMNLTRGSRPEFNLTGLFLGKMYHLHDPLPWYNTLVWTALTVPSGILILGAVGFATALRPKPINRDEAETPETPSWRRHRLPDSIGALVIAHWLVLMIVRALPGAPPHDGVRLFLPSFAFLAILAGLGAETLRRMIVRRSAAKRMGEISAAGLWIALCGTGAAGLWICFPQDLAYYNLLAGGQRGAVAMGMEPTYWWDALDRETLDWLHANTPHDRKIGFSPHAPQNLRWLKRWGDLRRGTYPNEPGEYQWYVLQYRPGALYPHDWQLLEHAKPAFVKRINQPDENWGPWRFDVPLILVYPHESFLEALGMNNSRREQTDVKSTR